MSIFSSSRDVVGAGRMGEDGGGEEEIRNRGISSGVIALHFRAFAYRRVRYRHYLYPTCPVFPGNGGWRG